MCEREPSAQEHVWVHTWVYGGYSSVYSLSVVSHMLEGLYLNYGMFKIREKQEQTVWDGTFEG